jgi:hypothetical protein
VWEGRRRIKSRGAIFRERPVEGEPGHAGRFVDVVHHTEWCCSHAKRALDIAMTSSESGLPIGASGAERERPRANPDSRRNRRSARDWVGQAPVTERACHRSLGSCPPTPGERHPSMLCAAAKRSTSSWWAWLMRS